MNTRHTVHDGARPVGEAAPRCVAGDLLVAGESQGRTSHRTARRETSQSQHDVGSAGASEGVLT
jgi:hypothetical protein